MKKKFVHYAKEAAAIVAVAIVLAFAYNIYSPKGIPLIPREKEVIAVSDDELFGSEEKPSSSDTSNVVINTEPVDEQLLSKDEQVTLTADSAEKKTEKPVASEQKAEKTAPEPENSDISKLSKSHDGDFPSVNYRQILKLKDSPDFLLIDARSEEFYSESHIGKAVNIFPYNENEDEMMGKVLDLPTDKKIVVYCDGGDCDSSHKLAGILQQFGFERIYLYPGGWEDWEKQQGKQ